MPGVSVVVPCYNYGRYLGAALASVAAQTFPEWECIIIDDGSSDDTRAVASTYVESDGRFRYVYQENRGLSAARNAGIACASGDYLQFLDADDLLEANKLAVQSAFLREHADVDVVYGEARFFRTANPEERRYTLDGEDLPWMPKISGRGRPVLAELLGGNIMVVSSPLVRREVFRDCGLFDEGLRSHEDWEFWLRCARAEKSFAFLDVPGTFALIRSHQQSMSRVRIGMYHTNLTIRRRLQRLLKDPELRRINRLGCFQIGFELALEHLENGNRLTGAGLLLRYGWRDNGLLRPAYGLKLLLTRGGDRC